MKTIQLQKSLKYYTNINIRYHEIIRLANLGLLGNVEHHNNSKHRNFTAENFNRAFIIFFAQKCLGIDWTIEEFKDLLDSKNQNCINELLYQIDRIETKGLPRFKELLMDMSDNKGI